VRVGQEAAVRDHIRVHRQAVLESERDDVHPHGGVGVAADAWGVRQRIPVLSSSDKAVAAGGWALLILGAITLALSLPVL